MLEGHFVFGMRDGLAGVRQKHKFKRDTKHGYF